eukprot:3936378-Rhodomonas_salina.1
MVATSARAPRTREAAGSARATPRRARARAAAPRAAGARSRSPARIADTAPARASPRDDPHSARPATCARTPAVRRFISGAGTRRGLGPGNYLTDVLELGHEPQHHHKVRKLAVQRDHRLRAPGSRQVQALAAAYPRDEARVPTRFHPTRRVHVREHLRAHRLQLLLPVFV